MDRLLKQVCLTLSGFWLAGCSGFNNMVPESVSGAFVREGEDTPFCAGLYRHNAWLDGAVAAENRWGVPIYISLAQLNVPLGTESSRYIEPTDADWQAYRIATENWQADKGDIATALDFLGWHGQLAVERNQISLEQADKLYLSAVLGHGGYHRLQYQPNLVIERQAERVRQRAARYRQDLGQCPRIRERAGSFFRWPW